MVVFLILVPIIMAIIAGVLPSNKYRPWSLPLTASIHWIITLYVLFHSELATFNNWLILDPLGKIILLLVSSVFLISSVYAVGYLRHYPDRSNRLFVACLLTLLGIMTLVTWAHHLGLMWVAIEGTTLVTAPLIYFKHSQQSIEATWKYLIVGSVGIALALLGTFFLAYSSLHEGLESTLLFGDLLKHAPLLSKPWLHASFVLLLVGYGTKMGLAPMHTWKPDVYGEVPGVVGALFAGAVTSIAFLAFMRIYQICYAAGESTYTSKLLIFMGLLSMAVAALLMVGQRDFKRLLAYSSVEHMGILMLGIGIGGPALFGTILHVVTNGLTKGVLFLSAGNIQRAYGSKNTDHVTGAIRFLPFSGSLFLAGFIAITGSPPFGPFISEFSILNGAFSSGRFVVGGLFLFLLFTVFIGMGATVLKVVQGKPSAKVKSHPYKETWLTVVPVMVFMMLVLLLGLYIPTPFQKLLHEAVKYLEILP